MYRSNFLFALIVLLAACAPNATHASVPLPTVTVSPVMTPAIIINREPAGFGLAPGMSVDTVSAEKMFVSPMTADAQKITNGEAAIPEQLNDQVAKYTAEMEKEKASVASICVVPLEDTQVVYKEGSVDNQVSWTLVYESGIYTCWALDGNGLLEQNPTTWDVNTGKVNNIGNSFERVEGHMGFAGNVPILVNGNKYVVPEGRTGTQLADPANWNDLESTASTGGEQLSLPNPIKPENMALLPGYTWDEITGSLRNIDGTPILSALGDKLFDKAGNQIELAKMVVVPVRGLDENGQHITNVILGETTVDGQVKSMLFNTKTGELVETPAIPGRVTENMDILQLPEIGQDRIDDGTLRLWILAQQYKWPEGTFKPNFNFVGRYIEPLPHVYLTMFGTDDPNRDATLRWNTTPINSYFYRLAGTEMVAEATQIYGDLDGDLVFTEPISKEWLVIAGENNKTYLEFARGGNRNIDWLMWVQYNNLTVFKADHKQSLPADIIPLVSSSYDQLGSLLPPGFIDTLLSSQNGAQVSDTLTREMLAKLQDKLLLPIDKRIGIGPEYFEGKP